MPKVHRHIWVKLTHGKIEFAYAEAIPVIVEGNPWHMTNIRGLAHFYNRILDWEREGWKIQLYGALQEQVAVIRMEKAMGMLRSAADQLAETGLSSCREIADIVSSGKPRDDNEKRIDELVYDIQSRIISSLTNKEHRTKGEIMTELLPNAMLDSEVPTSLDVAPFDEMSPDGLMF